MRDMYSKSHYVIVLITNDTNFRYLDDANFTVPWDTMNRMHFNFNVTTVTYRRLGMCKYGTMSEKRKFLPTGVS